MDNKEDYVPTLGSYAALISWMSTNPTKDIPVHMERDYKDAMSRAELRTVFARVNALIDKEE